MKESLKAYIVANAQRACQRLDSDDVVERYRARRYLRNQIPYLQGALFQSSDYDGGPGSGNWGHVGRPGKKGGSGSGGGKQFRLSTPSGGYTSRSQAEKENAKWNKEHGINGGAKPAAKPAMTEKEYEDYRKEARTLAHGEKTDETKKKLKEIEEKCGIKNRVEAALFKTDIERLPVKDLEKPLSSDEIIEKIAGGDLTEGSCSSLAFAYAANHVGLDVTDYRGGYSLSFFAHAGNIKNIASLEGVKSTELTQENDFKAVNTLMKTVESGKLYYLSAGSHAAIVRKNDDGKYEYLELQTENDNGFKPLTHDSLKKRFKCQKSHTIYGNKISLTNTLIDIDSLKGNEEFKRIVAYLNTQTDKQKKGSGGHVK